LTPRCRPRAPRVLANLTERLGRLGNGVGSDDQAKVYAALHARIPTTIAEQAPKAAEAGERAEAGRIALRGSDAAKMSLAAASASRLTPMRSLEAAGSAERVLRRMRLMASLTEAEMKRASAKTCAEVVDAADRAVEREARRIMRARREAARLRLTEDERYCHAQSAAFPSPDHSRRGVR
jgi:hypothetical protein